MNAPFHNRYAGRRVLVTGHTGFKGGWLSLWLRELGASVHGFSLAPPAAPSLYELIPPGVFARETLGDLRDAGAVARVVRETSPEFIFHLGAQSLVRRSYAEPLETLTTNALGTAHLLEAVRAARLPCPVVVVTSDKCYENRAWEHGYRESDPLGGHDVYSMSKAVTELITQSWRKSFFEPDAQLGPVVTVRAGNVIGGGDYAVDRIVPDGVRALLAQRPLGVRNPAATRPWQHVLDCLGGYLWLGARLSETGRDPALLGAFNFGPEARSNQPVSALVRELFQHLPGEWRDESTPGAPHEAALLHLSTDKAAARLHWFPTWDFATTVRETALWYRARHVDNADMAAFTRAQIARFTAAAAAREIAWARTA